MLGKVQRSPSKTITPLQSASESDSETLRQITQGSLGKGPLAKDTQHLTARQKRRRNGDEEKCDCASLRDDIRQLMSDMISTQNERMDRVDQHLKDLKLQGEKESKDIKSIVAEVQNTNSQIEKSLNFLSDQINMFEGKIQGLNTECALIKNQVMQLNEKIENMERFSYKTSIEIRNVPTRPKETKEDLQRTIHLLAQSLEMTIENWELRDMYRLPTKRASAMASIVVELSNIWTKGRLLDAAKRFRKNKSDQLSTKHLGFEGQSIPVYISERVTSKTKRLHFLARELAKTEKYTYCWVTNGKIFLRKQEGAPFIIVRSEEHLHSLRSSGLFYNNFRWGPGIQTHANLQEDVGLWCGNQLIRLAWRPKIPNVTLDLNNLPSAKAQVEAFRTLLTTRVRIIGEVNSAIELLKQNGADLIAASERWTKLYPTHCTDLASHVCHTAVFDQNYYKNNIIELEDVQHMPISKEDAVNEDDIKNSETYYAWNNSKSIIEIMKHCFKHEKQRTCTGINLTTILAGPRNHFKQPAKHELNCRTLIMASYLGNITYVTKLINFNNVHPDVSDHLGNTALMYATCGNHPDVVHFLIEAGAQVNNYNDSCCTPLAMAIIQFVCRKKDIAPNSMVQAVIPPSVISTLPIEEKPSEWHMTRDTPIQNTSSQVTKTMSKVLTKPVLVKRIKTSSEEGTVPKKKLNASSATEEIPVGKRKTNAFTTPLLVEKDKEQQADIESIELFCEEKQIYNNINTEIIIRATDLFSVPIGTLSIPYLFEYVDITKDLDIGEEENKKTIDKNSKKNASKVIKPSKDMIWQGLDDKDVSSINSSERKKIEMLRCNMMTIIQLLEDGADPNLVQCPQPALFMAIVSGCPDLIHHLVQHGANINEVFPGDTKYRPIDIAISQPLNYDNFEVIRAILECGARTDHRLVYGAREVDNIEPPREESGPTLLHVAVAKKTYTDKEEEIRQELIHLLLEYNCSALTQFKGHSSLELAMMKNMDLFEVFIKCPKVDLNAIINDSNQTVLVKMFSLQFCHVLPITERLHAITNMLLYGADPLLKCHDGEEKFRNIFFFAKQCITQLENIKFVSPVAGGSKTDPKAKRTTEKLKKDDKSSTKPQKEKMDQNDLVDYKQALDLVRECARMLHVRWIQAKLLKELLKIVEKYEHRHWNLIIPEHKNQKACGLWLTHQRSLEIWDIIQTGRKKSFKDRRILKHLLCIIHFCCTRVKTSFKQQLTAKEKESIESDVIYILHEHKKSKLTENMWAKSYVTPELAKGADYKFQVCFECALPLEDNNNVQCSICIQVAFCSYECMELSITRGSFHPCNENLRIKYFPNSLENISLTNIH